MANGGGSGIQRGYNLKEKRFSLFNVSRWAEEGVRPTCCSVVPTLYSGLFNSSKIDEIILELSTSGSKASSGFMRPEGVVIFHVASGYLFKKTIEKDDLYKGENVSAVIVDTQQKTPDQKACSCRGFGGKW